MDFTDIESGKRTIKRMKPASLSVKIKSLFSLKSNTSIAIIGTKSAISLMEGLSNTFITDFNITPIKTSKKEDGHSSRTLNSLFWSSTLAKKSGLLSRNVSKTGAKSKSGKGFATFSIRKFPKTHGLQNKLRSCSMKQSSSSTSGEKSFNCPCSKAKLTTFFGESLELS
jgi:hypothetical protein